MAPRVLVLALGGTIASVPAQPGAGAGVVPTLTAADLVAAVPGLDEVAQIDARTVRATSSASVTPADLLEVAAIIRAELASERPPAGVVVTQGTDTLEESAYLLDLLLDVAAPVVVTGAMRSPVTPGADGPANLLAAARVATAAHTRDLGVLVVFADEIHAARYVAKVHSSSPAAFVSPGSGPLGRVVESQVRLGLLPVTRSETIRVTDDATWPRVPILRVALGTDADEVRALAAGADGLVVEGVGGGHVPAGIVEVLEDVAARLPVVLASRTRAGGTLESTYGYVGGDIDLLKRGLISAGDLDALKARLRTAALIATGGEVTRPPRP